MKVFDINASPSEEVQARMALVQAQQSVKFSIQHRLASGEIRDVEVYSGPLKSGDKTLLHGIVFDVTDRNRAEEASRQSQERFRLAFDTSPDSININRLSDGLYVDINQGFTALTGFTRADAIGRTSLEINVWHDPADRQRLVKGLREKGSVENLEAQFRRKDGSLLTALMSARIITLDGLPHILSITRDISERIKSEQEKEHLKAQLHQAQKMEAIGTLAGGIAHDFNNILAAIMGFAELAQEDAKSGQPNPQHLTHILASAQRAKELVQRILTFSRKKEPDLQPLDLNHIVRRTQAMLERTLPKMIGIEAQLAPDLPPILADPTQMEQVLLNLAANARDAMPEGGRLTLQTRRLTLDQEYCRQHLEVLPGPYVMLRVSDTGLGMDEQTREHIFEPFYTTKDIGKGTGLGLSSAYGIIKNHGGHVDCQSQVGTGTTFIIHLPAMTEQDGGAPLDMNPVAPLGLRGTESILLVDDEADLRELGARTLGAMGYQVRTADSGEEALDLYRRMGGQLDLVILDLGMPGMGGHKAMQAILELNPQAKVIIA
ncbi:MAG: PAS domain S-box protein, partial [Desulfarculus sp.]|nr:PAS domain S-box protein [Desulfarculus sp.]